MASGHPTSNTEASPQAAADGGAQASLVRTLVNLWPHIWPGDRADLKWRVVWSLVLLLLAKLATLSVPFTFKWAIDALTGADTAPVQSSNWLLWLIASPLLMTATYGAGRILMALLTQWRDGIFAKVAMHAVRKLAYMTFVHMHELSLRFHLERKTGGLTRVLERGRTGIETMVRLAVQQLAPTVVELALMVAVLLYQFDWRYVAITAVTVVAYMYFTYTATDGALADSATVTVTVTGVNDVPVAVPYSFVVTQNGLLEKFLRAQDADGDTLTYVIVTPPQHGYVDLTTGPTAGLFNGDLFYAPAFDYVGSDSLTIADGGGRDNATTSSLAISGVEFDSLKMYATYAGQPSAPRLMIDNLSLTPAARIH